jgi:hypothetical protein
MYEKILYETVTMDEHSLDEQAKPFAVCYYLFLEKNEKSQEKIYGVYVEREYVENEKLKREPSSVALMTCSEEEAINLLEYIVKGKVTPTGFLDIVLDRLSYC